MKNLECTCNNAVPFWRCFHDKWVDDETFLFLISWMCLFSRNYHIFHLNAKKLGRLDATESEVSIGNFNVKA